MNWTQSALSTRWKIQPFIHGRYQSSSAAQVYDNINPATETTLCQVPVGDAADVEAAVRSARARFEDGSWSELPPARRGEILLKLADLVVAHKNELALLDSLEMGKPIKAALYDTETFAPGLLRHCAGVADKLLGQNAPLVGATLSLNGYEPRGVVGAITPWNYPTVCAVLKFGPALAAGNTVVLKPSELSPSSALKLAELALEAGVPEGVLNVVPGLGTTVGSALALHPDVDLLTFTGSTITGRKIMEMAGRSNGKPLLLEMGGKSPQLVFEDIDDLDKVADAAAQAVLANQGQVCAAHTRLIVHESIMDVLLPKIIARVRACQWGDPLEEGTTFGPLASPTQRTRVKNYIEQGLKAGAKAVLHGKVQETGGCYVSPTVFDAVDSSMSIVNEEIFGPVLCVQRFKTDEEALALANGSEFGLAATVWTRDMGRAKRLARAIKAGHISIRTSGKESPITAMSYEPQKASGFGSERGLSGLQSYSTLKAVHFIGA